VAIPEMRRHGYDPGLACGCMAAAGSLGIMIPPSTIFIVYGILSEQSIGKLFIAGFVPGLLMALGLSLSVAYYAKKRNYPRDAAFSVRRLGSSFIKGLPALMTPTIIIGGIMSGIFTPTEAAIAAVVYALVLGLVYRTLTFKSFVKISLETAETTAIILLIVAGASIFAWVLTANQVTEKFATLMLGISNNKIVILLIINAILLVVGCFMETIAAITILTPVFLPVMAKFGVDPIHFGVIMVLNLMIGLLTPPVGMVLFVLARVAKVPFERCAKATFPFLLPLMVVLLLITFIEPLCMWLPGVLFSK